MKQFMDKDFLLSNETAKVLYHDYAAQMPILDYHCHINPQEIWEDRRFENITQVWLGGDHYKWRVMRSNGVEEKYITGDAPDREKFQKFAEALPKCIGNPMYHWCHLELQRYFGYHGILNGETAEEVWNLANDKLRNDPTMTTRGLIKQSNVFMVGTTDDPIDSLEWHAKLAADPTMETKVCPSFRPDKAVNIHKETFVPYIHQLEQVVGSEFKCINCVRKALTERIAYFADHGCRASDHGLDYVPYVEATDEELTTIFRKAMAGETVTKREADAYMTALLLHCAREYAKRGLVMQIHFSCLRNTNAAMYKKLGADTGFDCIAITDSGEALTKFMSKLYEENALPKTILYSLNPGDNAQLGTFLGAFQGPEVPGKIQHGSGWWFNDTKTGMIEQMTSLANLGLLGNFIGMLTDSRSFLSYTRHEYFRRIMCNLIGTWVENGEYPDDMETLGKLVQDISSNNAKRYFGF
ncbi:MAG: glucuronate isomerase [Eubacteriales bacterium]|nr:glucuronate isomerase [Eubacteriales bacterium]